MMMSSSIVEKTRGKRRIGDPLNVNSVDCFFILRSGGGIWARAKKKSMLLATSLVCIEDQGKCYRLV